METGKGVPTKLHTIDILWGGSSSAGIPLQSLVGFKGERVAGHVFTGLLPNKLLVFNEVLSNSYYSAFWDEFISVVTPYDTPKQISCSINFDASIRSSLFILFTSG